MTKQTDDLTLYHFTCEHGHRGISLTSILLPNMHPYMRHLGPLLWLTDLAEPTAESVGLTSRLVKCDRMAYRYSVHTHAAIAWAEIRTKASKDVVADLELYSQPEHWYVVRRPLTASEFSFDGSYTRKQNVNEETTTPH